AGAPVDGQGDGVADGGAGGLLGGDEVVEHDRLGVVGTQPAAGDQREAEQRGVGRRRHDGEAGVRVVGVDAGQLDAAGGVHGGLGAGPRLGVLDAGDPAHQVGQPVGVVGLGQADLQVVVAVGEALVDQA